MKQDNREYLTYQCRRHAVVMTGTPDKCPVCQEPLTRTTRATFSPPAQKLLDAYRARKGKKK